MLKNYEKFLDEINQFCHNKGIIFEERINIILDILNQQNKLDIDNNIYQFVNKILSNNTIDKEELIQKIFMFYGDKVLKKDFDQFYTPMSIGKFISNLCVSNKKVIDPACGTGDLAVHYKNNNEIELWDISEQVTSLTETNYQFHNLKANIEVTDSIKQFNKKNETYNYVFLNPPFGSKTIITEKDILKNYFLGKDLKKQEIGILFIERSMNLLQDNGVAFMILPSGYLGNSNNNCINLRKYLLNYRIISLLRLPQNTFSRSGTGVSTYLIIVSNNKSSEDYDIHIKDIENIGYELNKKNTPFKYKKEGNDYVLDNDLVDLEEEILSFCYDYDIDSMKKKNNNFQYETVNTKEIKENDYILDIGRYLNKYKECLKNISNPIRIQDLIQKKYNLKFTKEEKIYTYLDIKEVNTPFYNGKNIPGSELPGRATYLVRKNDILVSKLKGNISFTLILNEKDNLVCTNGFSVLRPKNQESATIIFGNLFSPEFKIQHNSLTTGSIMETISEEDLKNIIITKDINLEKYQTIINSLKIIKNELS